MEAQPEVRRSRVNPDIWFYLFVGVTLGVICYVLYTKHERAVQEKQDQINVLTSDTTRLRKRIGEETNRANSVEQQLDRQAALYGQSAAAIADLRRAVNDQAERLSMAQQIDAIGRSLGSQYSSDTERIKRAATGADAPLIAELYRRVIWGEQQAGKLDTALLDNARLRADNERLTNREKLYDQTFKRTQQRLLNEYDVWRFLNIGKNEAIKKIAKQMDTDITELESELNATRR